MTDLQVGNPHLLELLHVEENAAELDFHKAFAHLHHRGEWFRLEGELANILLVRLPSLR